MAIPPGLILYTSKRFHLAFSTNIKYGISSYELKFVPYKAFYKKQRILLNKPNRKTLHSLHYTLPNTRFNSNYVTSISSRLPSLKKISLDFGKERILFIHSRTHQLLLRKLFSHAKTLSSVTITLNGADSRDLLILKSLHTIKSLQKLEFRLRFFRESTLNSFVENLNRFLKKMHKRNNWHFLKETPLKTHLLPQIFNPTSDAAEATSLLCLNTYLSSSLNKLDLLFYFMQSQNPQSLERISQRLEQVKNLEALALGSPTGLELTCFLPIIETMKDLKGLNFYFSGPNAYEMLNLLPKKLPSSIIHLDLRLDKLKEVEKTESFLRQLRDLKQLKRLKLLFFVQNLMGLSSFEILGESISQLKGLETLHIGCQKQNYEDGDLEKGIESVYGAVGGLENLKEMSLGFRHYHHMLTDKAIGKLCGSLKRMKNLEILFLDLFGSEVGNNGVVELARTIRRMDGLYKLHLDIGGGVWMSPEALTELNECIGRLRILSELVLKVRYLKINDEMAMSFVKMVMGLKELSFMDLCLDRDSMENNEVLVMLQSEIRRLQKRVKIDFTWPILE